MGIEKIGVVGAGTMGHGIGQIAAQAGFATLLCEVNEERVVAGLDKIRASLAKSVQLGKMGNGEREAALGRISTTTDLAEVSTTVEMVIEAVPENLELKREIFENIELECPAGVVLATNTSSLSVAAIATRLADPGRLIGMHFFNPVHVMSLIEIVRHGKARTEVVDLAVCVAKRMRKTPIVVNDVPGFATSRLGVLLGLEAMRMLEDGVASVQDIDIAMELGYRHPMGPLKLTDLVGLDVRLAIARYLHKELQSEAFCPPKILERMVDEGRLGKKSGHGFYEW
jgi:3-hydroxybutyryl-CoA dehydrogenase